MYEYIIYYVLTPIVVLFGVCKMAMQCIDFKNKIIKQNRLLLFVILLFNIIQCALGTSDIIFLQSASDELAAQSYCQKSGTIQLFLFDMACLITVWHMRVITKDAEDPTRNAKSATKMPLLISTIFSFGHINMVLEVFRTG